MENPEKSPLKLVKKTVERSLQNRNNLEIFLLSQNHHNWTVETVEIVDKYFNYVVLT